VSPRRARRPGVLLAVALVAVGGALAVAAAVTLPRGDLLGDRIPAVALDAYRAASREAAAIGPGCVVGWEILAAIGRVESNHGRVDGPRELRADGTVLPPIRGPRLDGTRGTQSIPDTDEGLLDGDATWDRAVGPLQFIPTTWAELGRDGNADGIADPDNLYDAALTAAAHLCLREPGNYADPVDLRRALIAYNRSERYANNVLEWVDRYTGRALEDLVLPSG
jgi:membrane-bound lytic murein transglycosylase B